MELTEEQQAELATGKRLTLTASRREAAAMAAAYQAKGGQ